MTTDEQAAWRALAARATKGKWRAEEDTHYGQHPTGFWFVAPVGSASDMSLTEGDAAYIAHSSPDRVIALLDHVQALEAREAGLREALEAVYEAFRDSGLDASWPVAGDLAQATLTPPTPEETR